MKQSGRVFITGDTHFTNDLSKLKRSQWETGYTLTKKDVLIIAGDFGFFWNHKRTKDEAYWLKWLDDRPWSTCFIDGNHENHDLLDNLQKMNKFGDAVGIAGHSIFHLLRGRVYKINNKRILTIGGAHSTDRAYREWGRSMWMQEEITEKDIDIAFRNIAIHHNKVDYVVTHCAPVEFSKLAIELSYAPFYTPDHSEEFLSMLLKEVEFKTWFFGHYHTEEYDNRNEKWCCVYNKIHEID